MSKRSLIPSTQKCPNCGKQVNLGVYRDTFLNLHIPSEIDEYGKHKITKLFFCNKDCFMNYKLKEFNSLPMHINDIAILRDGNVVPYTPGMVDTTDVIYSSDEEDVNEEDVNIEQINPEDPLFKRLGLFHTPDSLVSLDNEEPSEETNTCVGCTVSGGKKRKKKKTKKKRKRKTRIKKKRKTRKKSKRKKRKKRKTKRKQKGGSNINFKQKLLIKIKENKIELKNLFNNAMKRYYRGKKVIKFEDLITIVENMDEKKLIINAKKIGKLIKEKENTKKRLGKILRGGNPEVLFIFLGINSICAIFALLFYIMYNLIFPDEVASLYLYIAGGHEGIRNRHPNLTDEQIRTRIEEKSKEFQAFLAFTNFIACLLGAFSLINQIADEPQQRSYNHMFDFSLMLEDSGQSI